MFFDKFLNYLSIKTTITDFLFDSKTLRYEILVGVVVLFLIYYFTSFVRSAQYKLPPGPKGLPIVGYLPFLTENAHLDFIELGKKYGDIISLRLGTELIVVLNTAEVIREALSKDEFLGRPPKGILKHFMGSSAFFVDDVHTWREQRRFVVHTMKDLGLGRTKIETDIQDEINHFLEILRNFKGKSMDLSKPLAPSMSNNITSLVFGNRMEYDHPDRQMLDYCLDTAVDEAGQAGFLNFFPIIFSIPFLTKFFKKKGKGAADKIIQFCLRQISRHKETFDPTNVRDFIDRYIIEMKTRREKDKNTTFSDQTLASNALDLYAAGSETVKTSILWCMYTVAAYPEVQKKVQQEILDVIGPDRNPDYQDHLLMPYTQAVILEIMRWKTVVPLSVFRYTTADTSVGGYDVPKGTTVISNIWSAHHNPRNWPDPNVFNPERFLSADKSRVNKSNNFLAFSYGKRLCLGETMANMEVFMYFTSLLQKFDVRFPENFKPTFAAKLGSVYRLDPYEIRFIPRNTT